MVSENGGTPGWVSGPDEAPSAAPAGSSNRKRGLIAGATLIAAGGVAGAILTGTLSAGAATTPTASPAASSGSSSSTAEDPNPGDNGADGVAEAQEHHGRGGHGGGGALDLSGTVTAVGGTDVTIQTSSASTTYTVTSSSDIDKNGEAKLSDLKVGDAVTFSVTGTTIEKLHAGDETKNVPTPDAAGPSDAADSSTGA